MKFSDVRIYVKNMLNKYFKNKKVLDKFSETDGSLLYDGSAIEGGSSVYNDPDGASATIGGWATGDKAEDMTMQDAMYKLLHPYKAPVMTIGINPSKTLYDCQNTNIPTLKISCNITKGTDEITSIKYYFNNILISTNEDNSIKDGGPFFYQYTPSIPVDGDDGDVFNVKVVCSDGTGPDIIAQTNITFRGKTYYGCISDGAEINVDNIKNLSTDLKNKIGATYSYTVSYGRFICAFPTSLGVCNSIKDNVNNFNYTDSCTTTSMTIDSVAYTVISLTDPMGFDNIMITYA